MTSPFLFACATQFRLTLFLSLEQIVQIVLLERFAPHDPHLLQDVCAMVCAVIRHLKQRLPDLDRFFIRFPHIGSVPSRSSSASVRVCKKVVTRVFNLVPFVPHRLARWQSVVRQEIESAGRNEQGPPVLDPHYMKALFPKRKVELFVSQSLQTCPKLGDSPKSCSHTYLEKRQVSFYLFSCLREQIARNNHSLHFAGAFPDQQQTIIAIVALYRKIGQIARAAMDLDCFPARPVGCFRRE